MYTKILVPLDGSQLAEQILPFVRWLSRDRQVTIELLTAAGQDARWGVSAEDAADDYLRKILQNAFPGSSNVTMVVERGEPASIIVDRAKTDPGCLIALATHGMSGMRRWLLGSIASKIVQTATNPLLLVRPEEATEASVVADLKTVVVPLDGSGLAEEILPQVRDLAKTMMLEVHLVRVYTLPVHAFVVADGVIAQGPGQFRDELRSEAETYLKGKAEQLRAVGVSSVTATALQGDPASEVNDMACRTANDLIAMTTHGRSGVKRWVLGSVAEKIVQHSRGPVLLFRA